MVNLWNSQKSLIAILLLTLASTLSACGLKHYLGEEAPPPKIVSKTPASSSDGSGDCADWHVIYQGTEEESAATFECLVAKEPEVWKKIRGERPDELTEREIALLVRNGVLAVEGDREMWIRRLLAIKNLMGFGSTVTRQKADEWVAWARAHRAEIRSVYQKLYSGLLPSSFTYADGQTAAAVASSFIRGLGWNKSTSELASLMQDVFDFKDAEFRNGLEQGMRVVRNLMGFVCPMESSETQIDLNQFANCLDRASTEFLPSARWVEFMVNAKDSLLQEQTDAIRKSIDSTEPIVKKWFDQPGLKAIDIQLAYDWAKTIGAHPPDNFIDSLKFLRRLKSKSNEQIFDMGEMSRIFVLVREFEYHVLDAAPHFARAFREHNCLNPNATSWKNCTLRDYSVRNQSETIDMVLRVKNPRHGMDAVPINGSLINAVSFFDAVAHALIVIFDDNDDGIISANLAIEDDELVNLISTSIDTYQSFMHYIDNVGLKMSGEPANLPENGISLSQWNLKGFAKLVATSHDVLVERKNRKKPGLLKLFANLYNSFPNSSLFLDRPAITAIITTITGLPHYRQVGLSAILGDDKLAQKAMDDNQPFPRERLRERLPEMLRRNFPRTYESCKKTGFDISCGIAFDEIMSSPDEERKLITPSDLDVLTIVATGMEGVFTTCDRNGDGKLSASFFDGQDELDCGWTRMKDVAERLFAAKIVHANPAVKAAVDTLLEGINVFSPTRIIGKVAMIRGTKSMVIFNLPLFWTFGQSATMGSSYSLLSDIIANDRFEEIKRRSK